MPKWQSRCGNGWPAIVTRSSSAWVKSAPPLKRGGHISRLGRLAEDDVALGTVQRLPLPHAPLQSAPNTVVGERQRMRALKVAQQNDRLQRAVLLQQGKKVVLPIVFQGIGYRAPAGDLAMRRRCRVGIEAQNRNGGAVRSLNPARAAAVR